MGRKTSRAVLTAAMTVALGTASAAATEVRFIMDWAWQGPQAFALMARNAGCFEEGGIEITLDRGFGGGRVPVELAGGTYDMGFGDINPTIKFLAENPDSDLLVVAVMYSGSPLVAVVSADSDIVEPADFEGKTLAAPDFDTGRQLFPVFAAATGIDTSTIEWVSVSPELREPMLARGEVDGITGFVTSTTISLETIGMGPDQQRLFVYGDFGAELYSNSIITTRAFAEANPEAVSAVVACMIEGTKMAIADPEAAIAALVESMRWQRAVERLIVTPNVLEGGLSNVDMDYLQRSIMSVEDAYNLPNVLQAADLYTDAYLPPVEDRMLPAM